MTGVAVPAESLDGARGRATAAVGSRGLTASWARGFAGVRPWLPLVALMGLAAVAQLNGLALFLLLPDIKDSYHLGLAVVSLILALRVQLGLGWDLPVALIGNRVRRMRLNCLGMVGFVVSSVLTAWAGMVGGVILLDVATFGVVVAGGAFTSTQNSLLADYYPAERRPRVYYAHRAAIVAGLSLAPLLIGILKLFYSWQVVVLILASPAVLFIGLGLFVGEPQRRAASAAEGPVDSAEANCPAPVAAAADPEPHDPEPDDRPTLPETIRVLFANRSVRQIYYSLPLLAAAVIGIQQFAALFYQNVLHQDASQRNLILATVQVAALLGLVAGMVIVQRRMVKDPGRTVRLISLTGILSAGCLVGLAMAPDLGWAVGAHAAYLLASSWLVAGIYTVLSLLIPPRMLILGFALSTLWFQFGVALIAPAGLSLAGAIDGRWGFRAGIFLFAGLYLLGSAILFPAGDSLNADLARMRVTALADEEARRARIEGRTRLLMVRSLDAGYDGAQVLFGVDLDVDEGEIVAVLGTNGAGKTTLLRAISGLTLATAGEVFLDGRDITTWEPNRIVDRGVIQIPGGRGIFPALTVAESLRVAAWAYQQEPEAEAEVLEEVLGYFPILRDRWHTPAGSLSGGEQQMLSLAQAFLARPRLLMIDELSLGLAPIVVESLLGIVKSFHDRGTTVILVEQSINLALRLADRAIFMERGRVVYTGSLSELADREDIVRAVFLDGRAAGRDIGISESEGDGQPAEAAVPDPEAEPGVRVDNLTRYSTTNRQVNAEPAAKPEPEPEPAEPVEPAAGRTGAPVATAPGGSPVLATAGLKKMFGGVTAVNDVDLDLHDGEILGLIGPNGAGKTTVFELISGHLQPDAGRVVMFGEDITGWPAHRRAAHGLARSFQAARLWPGLTVQESVDLAVSKCERSPGVVPSMLCLPTVSRAERRIASIADEVIDSLGLGPFRDLLVSDLSTGTRRLVELAVMVALRPSILMLDEPSAGISQAETENLVPVLQSTQARLDCSVLLIEHDIGLMRRLADRIAAMDTGEVIVLGTPDEVLSHPRVMESYLGATTG